MSDFRIDKITNRVGDAGTQIAGISTFSGTSGMQLPVGPTEFRGGRGRAVFAGGYVSGSAPSGWSNIMDYVEIATTGNATDFGDLSVRRYNVSGCASATRGLFMGGQGSPGTLYNTIEYVTISSSGGTSDFGDLFGPGVIAGSEHNLGKVQSGAVTSNNTRGLYMGGHSPDTTAGSGGRQNIIQFVTITSTGDASEFGDMTVYAQGSQACASPTRAVRGAGAGNPANQQVIDYVTIATRGDAIHFGELVSITGLFPASLSGTTRGIFAGGSTPTKLNNIEYITIATLGNATDFGDLTVITYGAAGSSNQVRGVIAGGGSPAGDRNQINLITIASAGDASDFGDLTTARATVAGCSDAHGGLG